jgi:hypothetical protein
MTASEQRVSSRLVRPYVRPPDAMIVLGIAGSFAKVIEFAKRAEKGLEPKVEICWQGLLRDHPGFVKCVDTKAADL